MIPALEVLKEHGKMHEPVVTRKLRSRSSQDLLALEASYQIFHTLRSVKQSNTRTLCVWVFSCGKVSIQQDGTGNKLGCNQDVKDKANQPPKCFSAQGKALAETPNAASVPGHGGYGTSQTRYYAFVGKPFKLVL